MLVAVHALIYADDADAARAFFRDVVQWPHVDTDGAGWLIFATGPSEIGVHPNRWEHAGHTGGTDQRHELSLACDDLGATMADLASRGAEFGDDVTEQDWGTSVSLTVPGAGSMMLYQPKYPLPALNQD